MHLIRRALCGWLFDTADPILVEDHEHQQALCSQDIPASAPMAAGPVKRSRPRELAPARRYEIAKTLQRRLGQMSLVELRAECKRQGAHDLVFEQSLCRDKSSLRLALLKHLLEPWETNTDTDDTINAWLAAAADPWPVEERRRQPDMYIAKQRADAIDIHGDGPWSLRGCGVEIHACEENPAKGRGAFTTAVIEQGHVVGVYIGELLTQREHALRHAERGPLFVPPDGEEQAELDERRLCLEQLAGTDGAPIGGPDNAASYSFAILPDVHSQQFPGRIAYVDAENPSRSSWPRYINHASDKTHECNCEPKVDALKALVWFEARRRIEVGEELAFDCALQAGCDRTLAATSVCCPREQMFRPCLCAYRISPLTTTVLAFAGRWPAVLWTNKLTQKHVITTSRAYLHAPTLYASLRLVPTVVILRSISAIRITPSRVACAQRLRIRREYVMILLVIVARDASYTYLVHTTLCASTRELGHAAIGLIGHVLSKVVLYRTCDVYLVRRGAYDEIRRTVPGPYEASNEAGSTRGAWRSATDSRQWTDYRSIYRRAGASQE
jgi:hypothetical protein